MQAHKQSISAPVERIAQSILILRGQRVLLDSDLAALYGVETRVLLQAVKRNLDRFPADFMLQLTSEENCDLMLQFATSVHRYRCGSRFGRTAARVPAAQQRRNVLYQPEHFYKPDSRQSSIANQIRQKQEYSREYMGMFSRVISRILRLCCERSELRHRYDFTSAEMAHCVLVDVPCSLMKEMEEGRGVSTYT